MSIPILHVIGVPIGNVHDLTPRAREVLSSVDFLFCEDKRQTSDLLKRAEITTQAKLICLNEHQEEKALSWLEKMKSEKLSAGFVTDAGTASISDPGSTTVSLAHKLGIKVTPIPGASALTSFLSIIGAPNLPVHFTAFLPKKYHAKKEFLTAASSENRFHVFFESPHRISETIEIFKENPSLLPLYVGRELTKTYEQVLILDQNNIDKVSSHLIEKGEFICGFIQKPQLCQSWKSLAVHCLTDMGIKKTSQVISEHFSCSKNEVYQYLLEVQKNSKPSAG